MFKGQKEIKVIREHKAQLAHKVFRGLLEYKAQEVIKVIKVLAVIKAIKAIKGKKEVKEMLVILMGGRAAQMVKFGEDGIDAGAADDLRKARELARRAIEEWGMGSDLTGVKSQEADKWLWEAFELAKSMLEKNILNLDGLRCALS